MRGDPTILVECDHCHDAIEVRLVRIDTHTWTTESVNGTLARHGWVSDPVEQGDYCGEPCRKDATKGRRAEES